MVRYKCFKYICGLIGNAPLYITSLTILIAERQLNIWYKHHGKLTMFSKINMNQKKQHLIVYVVITIVTLAVFWQVSRYNFINFDDNMYVTSNQYVQYGKTPHGLLWAFDIASMKQTGLWNPLVWLSYMFDYRTYGLYAGGYHLTNLIFHILSALLLFWLFHRMTGAIWKSAFVAIFFAIHPLHVESVAWISERKDVLSVFLGLLTLCLYVYYTEKPVIKRYLIVLFCFACALMSKPTVVILPISMILLDYWPLDRILSWKMVTNRQNVTSGFTIPGKEKIIPAFLYNKSSENRFGEIIPSWQLREKTPFFILSMIMLIMTFYPKDNPYAFDLDLQQSPLLPRLANAPVAFLSYLGKTFWPLDLAVFYPFPEHILFWQVSAACLLILLISVAVVVTMKRLPYLFVGWWWYAITIAPVMGIIQISIAAPYAMADRYHYLSSIGLAVIMAWGLPALMSREALRKKIVFPTGIMFLSIMACLSWIQCSYWQDNFTLFRHAITATKNNYLAHGNFARELAQRGKYEEAIAHYNRSILIHSHRASPYYDRGTIYGKHGQYQQAIEDLNQALRLNPNFIKAYNNRGIVYAEMGIYQKALSDFNEAIRLKPDYADAHNNRAFVYFNQNDSISGCRDAQKACLSGNCKTLAWAKDNGYCR